MTFGTSGPCLGVHRMGISWQLLYGGVSKKVFRGRITYRAMVLALVREMPNHEVFAGRAHCYWLDMEVFVAGCSRGDGKIPSLRAIKSVETDLATCLNFLFLMNIQRRTQ